jgi:hypothetical protein
MGAISNNPKFSIPGNYSSGTALAFLVVHCQMGINPAVGSNSRFTTGQDLQYHEKQDNFSHKNQDLAFILAGKSGKEFTILAINLISFGNGLFNLEEGRVNLYTSVQELMVSFKKMDIKLHAMSAKSTRWKFIG